MGRLKTRFRPNTDCFCVSDDLFDIPAPARYADGCHHSFYFP